MKAMLATPESLADFCRELGLSSPAALVCRDNALPWPEAEAAYSLLKADDQGFLARLEGVSPRRVLSLFVQMAWLVRPVYESQGISEKIYLDTFRDIALWEREYFEQTGIHGLGEYHWLYHHVCMTLFRLGSLQFEVLPESRRDACGPIPRKPGELVLHVHIPKGADLSPGQVARSYQLALDFWDREEGVFLCESWFLGSDLQTLLPEGSRIRSFAAGFTRVHEDMSSRQAEERIFGALEDDPSRYPAETSLQASARAYLISGGSLGSGYGWQRVCRFHPPRRGLAEST